MEVESLASTSVLASHLRVECPAEHLTGDAPPATGYITNVIGEESDFCGSRCHPAKGLGAWTTQVQMPAPHPLAV